MDHLVSGVASKTINLNTDRVNTNQASSIAKTSFISGSSVASHQKLWQTQLLLYLELHFAGKG